MAQTFRQGEYRQGQHICLLYETQEEQLAVAAAYLADGLRAGERVLYVAESAASLDRFRTALAAAGFDVAELEARRALLLATNDDVHLMGGAFDGERMLHMLNEAMDAALNDGFTGLRTCGDMSWLLRDAPGASQVVEYEALLNHFFQGVRGAGMCQYDRRRLPPELVDHALATHTSVVLDGQHRSNAFYRRPEIAMRRAAQPLDVGWKLSELRRRS